MNQILDTKLQKNVNQILYTGAKKNINQILKIEDKHDTITPLPFSSETPPIPFPKRKIWFKFQFVFSIFILIILVLSANLYLSSLKRQEKLSNDLIANYNIYRLYSTYKNKPKEETFEGLFGIIQIPKINLYYPIFSHLTEDLLKIAPCKFYGDTPDMNGNICIAGHNYDNSLFFSKLSTLSVNDEIYIFDNNGFQYIYFVYDKYEVENSDLSPVYNYEKDQKTLTLVTCNNFNSNRIILKANQKKLF